MYLSRKDMELVMNINTEAILATAKLYLGGISARKMNYAYFNLSDDVIMLSNSSTGKKGSAHGDRLMNHAVGELSFHVVRFKDNGHFIRCMKLILGIPDGVCFAIHVPRLLALWNNCPYESLERSIDERKTVINITPQGVKYDPLKHFIGQRVEDFHVLAQLFRWYAYAMTGNDDCPHNSVNVYEVTRSGEAMYPVLLSPKVFREPCEGIFKNICINTILYDGLSVPSYKQFLNKCGTYSLEAYFWTEDGSSISAMYVLENDLVKVRSIRPNVRIIPLKLRVKMDQNINLK